MPGEKVRVGFIGSGFWVGDINWYQYMPQRLVVSDAASSDPKVAGRAWIELMRRRALAPLSENVEKKLTDLALKEQAKPSPSVLVDAMLQFVAQRFLDKKLTDQQADQFFLSSVNPMLNTRAVVAAGDPFPVQITYRGRGPSNGWSYRLSTTDVKVGDKIIRMGGWMGGSGLGAAGASTTYGTGQPPGEYPLEAHVRVEIFHAPLGAAVPPVWAKNLTLKSTLKVVPKNPSEMVKLVDQPELAEQIKKSLRIDRFVKNSNGFYDLGLNIEKPPINLAFSVFARVGGKEFRMGDIAADTSVNLGTSMNPSGFDIPAGKVQLIFRSDPAVARKTVDLVEIWNGEIVLDAQLKEQGK